jgi:aminobenzoyl-glutamate utilization protein B
LFGATFGPVREIKRAMYLSATVEMRYVKRRQQHMTDVIGYLDSRAPELFKQALDIWDFSELGFLEYRSAKVQADYLAENGFRINLGAGGLPTALVAEWGEGRPIIGFLGEYDALAGLSQEVSAERKPRVPSGPGHGCGHNLLGVGCLGAALAVKEYLKSTKALGTVRYYGCPAEELGAGKVYMAREGLFSDLDAAITWHPAFVNTVKLRVGTAINSVKFRFHGRTAHAAGDPHNGRSALDAVELMNVGANYLREHTITTTRLHYVITNGGGQPNVVPAEAEVWYVVRAPHRFQVEETHSRLVDIAKGAALMTGTSFEINFLTGCHEMRMNKTLIGVQFRNLEKVGPPKFDQKDFEFAAALAKTFDKNSVEFAITSPEYGEYAGQLRGQNLHTGIMPLTGEGVIYGGSTDVGDVSWIVPTVSLGTANAPIGCPSHSWQHCASNGSGIGLKAMLIAAKVQALTAIDLIENPDLLRRAKAEFDEKAKDNPYECAFPAGRPFPLDEFFRQ